MLSHDLERCHVFVCVIHRAALVMPEVYCYPNALRATMNKWLVAMETVVGSEKDSFVSVSIEMMTFDPSITSTFLPSPACKV